MNKEHVENFRTKLIKQNEDLKAEDDPQQRIDRIVSDLDELTDQLAFAAEEIECKGCTIRTSVMLGQALVAFNIMADLKAELNDAR